MRYLKTYTLYERVKGKYMKHLKQFNESKFENSFINQYNKILPELNDILLPFNDSGIKYQIYQYSGDNIGEVNICVSPFSAGVGRRVTKKFFTWNQIKEEMLHVISFMNSEGIGFYKVKFYTFDEYHYIEMYDESEIEELEDSFKFTKFEITFCKTP